jgi:hypothetical protein
MHIGRVLIIFAVILAAQYGCHSIPSSTIRDLIKKEGTKIDAAQSNSRQFHEEAQKRVDALKSSIEDLNQSIKLTQAAEAKHSLITSSPQPVLSKTDVEAWAISYLIAKTYLAEYEGLEQAVVKQFDDDFCALLEAANQVEDSWADLGRIHTLIERYADKSALASLDPKLVGAIAEQVPGGSERLAQVLQQSSTLNDALQEAMTYQFLKTRTLERTRSLTVDLMDLLERVK